MAAESSVASTSPAAPGLKRSLTLWHLVVLGIVIVQPIAPMGVFGVINNEARGHVVTTILVAMVAMLFTRVQLRQDGAHAYPSALSSAYTYVGREIHPALGYLVGWAMVLDYILNPLVCTVICSKLTQNILPGVPYAALVVAFAGMFTLLNLRAIQSSARINEVLAAGMMIVVVIFFAFVVRFLWDIGRQGSAFFSEPLYNPATFSFHSDLFAAPPSPSSPTSDSTAFPRSPKKWKIRAATSCWPPFWFASSPGYLLRLRFTPRSWFGDRTRFHRKWWSPHFRWWPSAPAASSCFICSISPS